MGLFDFFSCKDDESVDIEVEENTAYITTTTHREDDTVVSKQTTEIKVDTGDSDTKGTIASIEVDANGIPTASIEVSSYSNKDAIIADEVEEFEITPESEERGWFGWL
jgi:hypothetical protein